MFREWDRIAKELEVYKMHSQGSSLEHMKEIDSQPSQLIKLASFYYSAVKIGGDDLKRLLRRGRGKSGGKTIIFERLFSYSNQCGYSFRNKPSYKIMVKDKTLFEKYTRALVHYLKENPNTKTQDVDKQKDKFLDKLKPFGFPPERKETVSPQNASSDVSVASNDTGANNTSTNSNVSSDRSNNNSAVSTSNHDKSTSTIVSPVPNSTSSTGLNAGNNRYSIKHKPTLKRKQIPSGLKKLIDECYGLDENNFANAKTALVRVTLECTLKYVVENTIKQNGKSIKSSNHFNLAFNNSRGVKLLYTNFDILKTKFTELIMDVGIKKAFEDFDLENTHQIIHNYRVAAVPANAKALCDNLIDLLEFMLQDEVSLLSSLDIARL